MKFSLALSLIISSLVGQSTCSWISTENLESQSSVYLDSANDNVPIFNSASTSASQDPVQIELPFNPSDYSHLVKSTSNAKVSDIIASQNGAHVHLSHSEFPDVKMRVKRIAPKMQSKNSDQDLDPEAFCDTTVTSWSGCE